MKISQQTAGGACVLRLEGRLDRVSSVALREALGELTARRARK